MITLKRKTRRGRDEEEKPLTYLTKIFCRRKPAARADEMDILAHVERLPEEQQPFPLRTVSTSSSALKQPPRQRRSLQYARMLSRHIPRDYQLARAEAKDCVLDCSAPHGYWGCKERGHEGVDAGNVEELADDDLAELTPKQAMEAPHYVMAKGIDARPHHGAGKLHGQRRDRR